MTTPAIQVLPFDDGLALDGGSVGGGVMEIKGLLVDMMAMLEEVGTAGVAPTSTVSTLQRFLTLFAKRLTTRTECNGTGRFHETTDSESRR
jgi:hypothetical protein